MQPEGEAPAQAAAAPEQEQEGQAGPAGGSSPLSTIGLSGSAGSTSGYGESSAVLSGGNKAGGGTLWKLFTASSGSSSAPPAVPGASNTGLTQSGDGLSMSGSDDSSDSDDSSTSLSGGDDDSDSDSDSSDGGDSGVPDPAAILGKSTTTSAARKLTPAQKAQIASQMQALRQSIMGDFKSTTDMGQQAGYLPPPPVA
jgi:hypothetical protein